MPEECHRCDVSGKELEEYDTGPPEHQKIWLCKFCAGLMDKSGDLSRLGWLIVDELRKDDEKAIREAEERGRLQERERCTDIVRTLSVYPREHPGNDYPPVAKARKAFAEAIMKEAKE